MSYLAGLIRPAALLVGSVLAMPDISLGAVVMGDSLARTVVCSASQWAHNR